MERCTLTISTSSAHPRPIPCHPFPHSLPSLLHSPPPRATDWALLSILLITQRRRAVPRAFQSHRGSVTMMGDNLPEEPEACVVNPGNFSSSNSRVLNHLCDLQKIFLLTPKAPICLPTYLFTSLDRFSLTLSKQIYEIFTIYAPVNTIQTNSPWVSPGFE
jgi:hypothetical protein